MLGLLVIKRHLGNVLLDFVGLISLKLYDYTRFAECDAAMKIVEAIVLLKSYSMVNPTTIFCTYFSVASGCAFLSASSTYMFISMV